MIVFDLDYEDVEYGYRMDGQTPSGGHRFDPSKILLDPIRQSHRRPDVWGQNARLERCISPIAAG